MALPKYTEPHYRIWHYMYIFICTCVFFFLIAPLFVIFPLSFNAEEFLSFSEGMKNLDPDAFSLRWYKDMICLLYTSPSPRDAHESRMPSSA